MTGAITKEQVLEALGAVIDPELGVDIVNLGLVYAVTIDGPKVRLTMTLTTMGCPEAGLIEEAAVMAVGSLPGVEEVEVEWTFDPPWTPNLVTEEGLEILQALGYL